MRACWNRAFLSAPVGSGKTATCIEFVIAAAAKAQGFETTLICTPLNLYSQWRQEIKPLEPSAVRWNFVEQPCKIEPAQEHRAFVFKSSIFDALMTLSSGFCFTRLIVDEADSIKLQWRNIATRLMARQLWYISASADICNMGSMFLGRRYATAIGYSGERRPVIKGEGIATPEWNVRTVAKKYLSVAHMIFEDGYFCRDSEIKQTRLEIDYALGKPTAELALVHRVNQRYNARIAALDGERQASSIRAEQQGAEIQQRQIKKALASAAAVKTGFLHNQLEAMLCAIPPGKKVLLICANPKQNIGQLNTGELRMALLKGQETALAKMIDRYKLPHTDAQALDVLMLDSQTPASITGMNLEMTTIIVFADDTVKAEMKKQAMGRALRMPRDPQLKLVVVDLTAEPIE